MATDDKPEMPEWLAPFGVILVVAAVAFWGLWSTFASGFGGSNGIFPFLIFQMGLTLAFLVAFLLRNPDGIWFLPPIGGLALLAIFAFNFSDIVFRPQLGADRGSIGPELGFGLIVTIALALPALLVLSPRRPRPPPGARRGFSFRQRPVFSAIVLLFAIETAVLGILLWLPSG